MKQSNSETEIAMYASNARGAAGLLASIIDSADLLRGVVEVGDVRFTANRGFDDSWTLSAETTPRSGSHIVYVSGSEFYKRENNFTDMLLILIHQRGQQLQRMGLDALAAARVCEVAVERVELSDETK